MPVTLGGSTITMNSGAVVQDPASSLSCYFVRVYCNFNGTGSVGASQTIRRSFGISSISKSTTGHYTANFSSAFPDANYIILIGGSSYSETPQGYIPTEGQTPTSITSGRLTTSVLLRTTNPAAGQDTNSFNFGILY